MAGIGALGSIPGLGGFVAGDEELRQQQAAKIQQAVALQGVLSRAQANQREQGLRGALSQLPADATQEQVMNAARPFAGADQLLRLTQSSLDRQYTVDAAAQARKDALAGKKSNLSRLMEERDALPAGDPRRTSYDNAIRKESETAKQISPTVVMPRPEQALVPIVGPDGKPTLVRREDAIGKTPYAAGSAMDKKTEQVDNGRQTVNSLIATLRDQYDQLEQGGGITDPAAGPVDNLKAGISSSGVGQFVGRMVGTQNQSARNQIAQQRPLLLNAIKQATGMSAKQMDSNAELKLYLSAATDPTLDIRANRAALDKLDELYGLSGKQPAGGGGGGLPNASAIDAELARRRKK